MVIIANTSQNSSHRDGLLYDLFKTYITECKKQNISVSILDLAEEDAGFLCNKVDRKDKIDEYQIKIKNADMITFFHPALWSLPSSDIKGFVDKVFVPGFAYTTSKGIVYGQLESKRLEVFAVSELKRWHEMFVSNNALSYFWKRILSEKCGFYKTNLHLVSNYRSLTENQIQKTKDQISLTVSRYNQQRGSSILDLF